MNWTCDQTDDRVSEYLEKLLSPEESAAFVAHAKTCSYCDLLAKRVAAAMQMMHATPAPEPPSYLATRIIGATVGAQAPVAAPVPKQSWWQRWFSFEGILWQPQFAMGAVTVAASFLIVLHAAAKSQNVTGFAALNPAIVFQQADRQVHLAYAHTVKYIIDQRLVYEIESRLEPQAEPAVFEPQQQRRTEPGAQPRSEHKSRPENPTAQTRNLYAAIVPGESFSGSALPASSVTRSLL
jgi:putative zinc finger protein